MNYDKISKETINFLYQSRASLRKSPLDPTHRILAELRVSQINSCAYCCQLHTDEARKLGISQEKLDLLPSWRNSTLFTPEEKIVLEWVEALTNLDQDLTPIKQKLSQTYSERQLVDLTATIAIMNAFNRIVISLRD